MSDTRRVPALDSILQDLRYTFRTLCRDPGFTTFAILIVGLGIGASATVFSVVDTLLLRPLPFREPERLVWIANHDTSGLSGQTTQVGHLLDLRERNRSFTDLAAYFAFYGVGDNLLSGGGEPERLSGVPVSENFFQVLGIQPQLGRLFTADECKWHGPKAVLLSYGLWARRFGSDPGLVGRKLTINDEPVTVAGVLPASFDMAAVFAPGSHFDLYFPFPLSNETNRWGNTMAIVGRLKPGVAIGSAQAEMKILADQITRAHPERNDFEGKLTPLAEHVSGRIRPALLVLACAVGVVMLIVCANLSNLLLARTATRQKEIAIRTALGAGRRRLIRQMLTEGIALILLRRGARRNSCHRRNLYPGAPRGAQHPASQQRPHRCHGPRLLPSGSRAHRRDLRPRPRSSGSRHRPPRRAEGHRARFHRRQDPQLDSRRTGGCRDRICLRAAGQRRAAGAQLSARARCQPRLPPRASRHHARGPRFAVTPRRPNRTPTSTKCCGASGTSRASPPPDSPTPSRWDAIAPGARPRRARYTRAGKFPTAFVRVVSDGYLKALGISLIDGRDISERDVPASEPVIVINQTLARTLWPGQNAIGQIMRACGERHVVGVVGDVRHLALEQASGMEMYLPMRQCNDIASVDLVVRSSTPPGELAAGVRAALRPIAPNLPGKELRPLQQLVDKAVSPRRFVVLLLGGFAIFALLLASLGIYGVVSYGVNQRTQEIGIRMALGASASRLQAGIILQTLGLAAVGMLIGSIASRVLARALGGLLFGVTATDPLTFLAMPVILTLVAVAAGYLPARRASRIDPSIALRAN